MHEDEVNSVAFSLEGIRLASISAGFGSEFRMGDAINRSQFIAEINEN